MIGLVGRAFAIALACFMPLNIARAEVHVSGSKDAMTVQTKDASLGDVIAAVNAALHVTVRIAPAAAIPVTGTYTGSLRRVLARMLAGHDFILESSGDKMTILLTTQAGRSSIHGPAAAARANVAADEEPNTSGVQGWVGGFSAKSPGQAK